MSCGKCEMLGAMAPCDECFYGNRVGRPLAPSPPAELEATQVSPAMVAEFEGGKAQRDKLRARIAELEQSERDSVDIIGTLSARIAELEATQVSPAMVAEFEGGKAQREALRARVDAAKAILDSWDHLETNYWAGHGDDPRYNAVRQALRDFWESEQIAS